MSLAKLDNYDYYFLPGVVQITMDSSSDPILVDILSEIDRSNGKVYVEGRYFMMSGYDIVPKSGPGTPAYLNLQVTTIE